MGCASFVAILLILQLICLSTNGEWVDYPSSVRCCSDIPVERCDPWSADANAACRDVCHYGGCKRGGQCEERFIGAGRYCHCNC